MKAEWGQDDKVVTLARAAELARAARKAGRTVVFANGTFDLMHVGHVRYLKGARREGDLLIVGLNDDAATRKLKGPGRPFSSQEERAEMVASFYFVDYVTVFSGYTAEEAILTIRPDVHAKGADYTTDDVPEREVVRSYGGRVAITGDPKDHSSTSLAERVSAWKPPGRK